MAKPWAGTTYGNGWMHKWLIRMLKVIDVRIIYLFTSIFIIPVCLIVNPSRGIAYRCFRRRHNYGPIRAAWHTYLNHCKFGQVVIDRFAMYAGKRFEVEIDGYENFTRLAEGEEGFIQLSAHTGNYEIAGYTLNTPNKNFNALVFFGEKESVMKNRESLFNKTNITMIPVSPDMSHVFVIDQALSRGEIVSMPADRLLGSTKKIRLPFLGADADFPFGPFSIATMRGLDTITVHVMKEKSRKYKIYVRRLEYDKDAPRKQQIEQLSRAYVGQLEETVRKYPDQWYNYYEFWNDGKS